MQYKNWLADLKSKVRSIQIKAALAVNKELLTFYWELGADIVQKQSTTNWGDGFLSQLSADLIAEFPDMKGFSVRNLKYVRQWYLFYSQTGVLSQQAVGQIGQQAVAQITQIPWGHNIAIIAKCKNLEEASD